jgi:PEP-CTERM motif-containing protein
MVAFLRISDLTKLGLDQQRPKMLWLTSLSLSASGVAERDLWDRKAETLMNSGVFLAAGAILFASVGGASANILNAEFTGNVNSGICDCDIASIDNDGIFGAPGADLTGFQFTADFLYDTALGTFFQSPTESFLDGGLGTPVGGVSPVLEADLTINGVTLTINPALGGGASAANGQSGVGNADSYEASDGSGDSISLGFFNPFGSSSGDIPGTIDVPLEFTVYGSGYDDSGFGVAFLGTDELILEAHTLSVTLVSATAPSVPEPSTWAMMLLGLAGLGFATRRVPSGAAAKTSGARSFGGSGGVSGRSRTPQCRRAALRPAVCESANCKENDKRRYDIVFRGPTVHRHGAWVQFADQGRGAGFH